MPLADAWLPGLVVPLLVLSKVGSPGAHNSASVEQAAVVVKENNRISRPARMLPGTMAELPNPNETKSVLGGGATTVVPFCAPEIIPALTRVFDDHTPT